MGENRRVVLISCSKSKKTCPAKAMDFYIGSLFKKSLAYSINCLDPDLTLVLSGLYGVVELNTVIYPYDLHLCNLRVRERRKWAEMVLDQLSNYSKPEEDHFIILASNCYREFLIPKLNSYEIPMKGLRQGEQLQFLTNEVNFA